MKPRVGSYGDTATVTRSPRTTRMRCRRTLPASLARTSWPLSSFTRKFPPLAMRTTSPSRWTSSSLLTGGRFIAPKPPRGKRPGRIGVLSVRRADGTPGPAYDVRRDRPLHPHVLLAPAVVGRRPRAGLRGGAPLLTLLAAHRRAHARARPRRF